MVEQLWSTWLDMLALGGEGMDRELACRDLQGYISKLLARVSALEAEAGDLSRRLAVEMSTTEALEAERDRLREALRPFAAEWPRRLTMADWDAARAALAGEEVPK